MKLIIQIPCFNEQASIADTIRSLPTHIEGVDSIEVVVVDDGSADNTVAEAARTGACRVVKLERHRGLAGAFMAGVKEADARGADILVNTDADLQYPSSHIPALVAPIVEGRADIVIGDRLSHKPSPFGPMKMMLERLGSRFVRLLSGTNVRDAASGFRAFNREALTGMFLHGKFSYTLETLILAGIRGFRVSSVTIPVNPPRRKSRLFKSIPGYIFQSFVTMVRAYLMYHPLRFFTAVGGTFMGISFVLGMRFMVFFFLGRGGGHIQSLILMAVLAIMGFLSIILGLIGDVVAANRRLLEDLRAERSGAKSNGPIG